MPEILKNIILIRAIDTGSPDGRLGLSDIRQWAGDGLPILLGLNTSRNFAHVKFLVPPSIEEQLAIISAANKRLEEFRTEYNSVFLTAFRNSTEYYSRKRIGFDVMYKMIANFLGK